MFLGGVLYAFIFVALEVAICAPAGKEKIDPVDLNYFCFRLKQNDNDNKSPILLIHGLCSSSADWNGVYETLALETGRRVCAVDLRNHGDSPWNNRSDIEAMAVDIGHFLDEKKIPKVNLIGHSLGGKISIHYALKNPNRVNSLIVEDMRPNSVTLKGIGIVKAILNILQKAIKSVPDGSSEDEVKTTVVKFIMKQVADIDFKDINEEMLNNFLAFRLVDGKWRYKMNLDLFATALEKPEEFLTVSSGLYNGPAMFIYGTKSDFDVAGDESNILKLFPNAKLIPVKGAGHVIHGIYRQFEDEVIKFLDKIN